MFSVFFVRLGSNQDERKKAQISISRFVFKISDTRGIDYQVVYNKYKYPIPNDWIPVLLCQFATTS